jgi:hypothetical protein
VKPWQIRAIGVIVLVGLLLTLRGFGPWETLIWFFLLALVLKAPIPPSLRR